LVLIICRHRREAAVNRELMEVGPGRRPAAPSGPRNARDSNQQDRA
jgi:hypothetical protein